METTKDLLNKLNNNKPIEIKSNEYEFKINLPSSWLIQMDVFIRSLDQNNNHLEWSDQDKIKFIQDLKDFANWRKYKELKQNLSE